MKNNRKLTDEELMAITGGQAFLEDPNSGTVIVSVAPTILYAALPDIQNVITVTSPVMNILYAAIPYNKNK